MDKINFVNYPSTTTPINADNLNLLQTNVENAINQNTNKINDLNAILLWEDTSGTSEMGATTLDLSTGDYDYAIIYCWRSGASSGRTLSFICENGKGAEANYVDYYSNAVRSWNRQIALNDDTCTVSNGTISGSTNNAALKPYKIVGFKVLNG